MNKECNKLLEDLYHQYYESVYSLCLVVADFDPTAHQLIEDCIHDAFIKAIIYYDRYKHYKNPMGWIARVATNKLKSDLAKEKRHAKVTPIYSPEKLAAMALPTDEIDSELRQKDVSRKIAQIYDMLTPQEKTIFVAYFLEDKSVDQTAKDTGLSVNSVRAGVRRIRQKARSVKDFDNFLILWCLFHFLRNI